MTEERHGTKRRAVLGGMAGAAAAAAAGSGWLVFGRGPASAQVPEADVSETQQDKWDLSREEWRERLTEEEFRVLRKEGTEPPGSSPLNDEKRAGTYTCAGCGLALFTSDMKFDSGTGWPSFYDVIDGAVETKRDFKLILPRTEYHCARCGGHQGHVFEDGPEPTGLRYCNNGVALDFEPEESEQGRT